MVKAAKAECMLIAGLALLIPGAARAQDTSGARQAVDALLALSASSALGASLSGYMMSAQTMILELGAREDLPMRIAVSASAEAVTATAGPLFVGLMAQHLGYTAVFGSSVGFLAAALTILLLAVKDPRQTRRTRRC